MQYQIHSRKITIVHAYPNQLIIPRIPGYISYTNKPTTGYTKQVHDNTYLHLAGPNPYFRPSQLNLPLSFATSPRKFFDSAKAKSADSSSRPAWSTSSSIRNPSTTCRYVAQSHWNLPTRQSIAHPKDKNLSTHQREK